MKTDNFRSHKVYRRWVNPIIRLGHLPLKARLPMGEWLPRVLLRQVQNWPRRFTPVPLVRRTHHRDLCDCLGVQPHPHTHRAQDAASAICAPHENAPQ